MRFGLQEVKRQVSRRAGELTLMLHFLRPGELRAEIARLVAYHEQHLGQPRRNFAQDEALALIGDYRLGACLLTTLSAWYTWQSPAWTTTLDMMDETVRDTLDTADLRDPVALRLVLFDYVNAQHAGFLDSQTRQLALQAFATSYKLDVAQLETLLALDSEAATVLTRAGSEPPAADAVAELYNRQVFEAALFNSSEVHFTLDSSAFLAQQRATPQGPLTGLGAVIKRLCFLARKLGVYYDLAYAEPAGGTIHQPLLHLTLYGPQEMTGGPQQYGQRLARLCRLLLGYGTGPGRQAGTTLGKALRRAEARVHLFQQVYRFRMDADLLALLPAPTSASPQEHTPARVGETAAVYDSGIEQSFAEAFAALERAQATEGWQLEREPEPLLLPIEPGEAYAGIFIPDFALTRGPRRISIEILGFWTPSYRERKLRKLLRLRGHADLVLALPTEARQFFAALADAYPLIEYRTQLSASDLLRVLHTRYDDFADRLATLDGERARSTVRGAQFIPERACYELLTCYRRDELAQAAARVLVPGEIAYTPGIGLYLLTWMEHLQRSFVEWVEAQTGRELSLSQAIQTCRTYWPELAACDDAAVEALLALWPAVEIRHDSIFEARLLLHSGPTAGAQESEKQQATVAGTQENTEPVEPAAGKVQRVAREKQKKQKKQKKHELQEREQQNLWG